MENNHVHTSNNTGFIVGAVAFLIDLIFENMGTIDSILSILVKITSLVSFSVWLYRNFPDIKKMIFKTNKKDDNKEDK